MTRVLFAALAVFASACTRALELSLPAIPEGGSVLIAAVRSDALELIAAGGSDRDPIFLDIRGKVEVYAFIYTCPLQDLSIAPGKQIDPHGFLIPEPLHQQKLDLSAGTGEWIDAPELPAILHRAPPSACATIEQVTVDVSGDPASSARTAIALEGDRVLVPVERDDRQELWIVTRDGATLYPLRPAASQIVAGFEDDSGRIWLLGRLGDFWVGSLSSGFAPAPAFPAALTGPRAWIDGARGGAPFELFAATSSLSIARFDGDTWTELREPSACDALTCRIGSVRWIGPGDAYLAIPADSGTIYHYARGVLDRETVARSLDVKIIAVANIPEWGLIAGSMAGSIYEKSGPSWSFRSFFCDSPMNLEPLDSSALIACGRSIYEIDPSSGACPPFAAFDPSFIGTVGGDRFAVHDGGGAKVTFIRWTRAAHACP